MDERRLKASFARDAAHGDEVRAFCAWISDGLGRLLNDNGMLQAEVQRLRNRLLEGEGNAGISPADVHGQAVNVLSPAQPTADRYVAGAQVAAGLPGPVPRGKRRGLQAEIAYLRTFSDVCRTHLCAYLESLTRSIEEWERAERNRALVAKDSVLPT